MSSKKTKLELTWIGKEHRPRLEPRILLEEADKSHHAKFRVREPQILTTKSTENTKGKNPASAPGTDQPGDIFDNMLIRGDNLLGLKALEQEFAGKVKCVYIDPPFNTGDMFENYDDGLEHSIWLSQMRDRFELFHRLLSDDGSIFVHLNDDELDYCKILLDEKFMRKNFVNRITVSARSPSAFSTVNPGVFKASEYLLWFAKDRSVFKENGGRVTRSPDYAYNKWIENPDESYDRWKLVSLTNAYEKSPQPRSKRPDTMLEHFNKFIVQNASRICRLAAISDSGAGEAIVDLKKKSQQRPGKIFLLERDGGLDPVYVLDGQQLIFYSKNVVAIDGELRASRLMTNIWDDIAWEGIAGEGNVTFRKGKKPERLIRRVLDLATNPGDLVLDSFLGSGTTAAVAHKMGRRWIGIELGEHCETHCLPRLKKVVDGEDSGGITAAVGWNGGGGFRYYRLAPSLLEKDKWDNWVVSKEYNAAMLAEAVCKLEGFSYEPSDSLYWQHGHSTERDFIYTTTANLSHDQLQELSDEVGPERSLLVVCSAFRGRKEGYPNLTVKKIPNAVLTRCEWGKDDYSLKVENLPKAPPEPGQQELF